MPTLVLICFFGSEVRQFSHSGVITRLLDSGWNVVILSRVVNDEFCAQFDTRTRIEKMPAISVSGKLKRVTSLLDKAHSLRELRLGNQGWIDNITTRLSVKQQAFLKTETLLAQSLLSIHAAQKFVASREKAMIPPLSAEWKSVLAQVNADVIVTNLPRIDTLLPLWKHAEEQKIPVVVCYHTRKSKNSQDRLLFSSVRLGAWNAPTKDDVSRQNPRIPKDHIRIIGCTHFSCVGQQSPQMTEANLRRHIGARADSPLILYCAAAPYIIRNEDQYVKYLLDAIAAGQLTSNTQVVVRTNPVDHSGQMASALKQTKAIVVPPDWCWEREISWCYQRKADQVVFNSLLHAASVCVGLPSTLSLECAIAGVPVVNIGFLFRGASLSHRQIEDFWNAEFNVDVRQTGAALCADNAEHLLRSLQNALGSRTLLAKQQSELLQCHLGVLPEHSVEAAVDLIQSAAYSLQTAVNTGRGK